MQVGAIGCFHSWREGSALGFNGINIFLNTQCSSQGKCDGTLSATKGYDLQSPDYNEVFQFAREHMQTEGYTLLKQPSKASVYFHPLAPIYRAKAMGYIKAMEWTSWTVQNGYPLPVSPGDHSIHLSFDSSNSTLDALSGLDGCDVYYTVENVKRP